MEDNITNYYAIIPANVRYSKQLRANEKLLYAEITALANKNGYCYAQNRYFAKLYNATAGTVSRWISHLHQLGFIDIVIKKNEKNEIIARYIYIADVPYTQKSLYPSPQKNQYPYTQKDQEGIRKKRKENNINNNIDDDLFYAIINKSCENEFYSILEKLELNYTEDMLDRMQADKVQMIKDIIYVLYDLYNSEFDFLLSKFSRESLLNLYRLSLGHTPDDLLNYYKRTIINKYTNNST